MKYPGLKVFKGICYFPSYEMARSCALSLGLTLKIRNNWPRANHFDRGWAIQLKCSGPYVNHSSSGPTLSQENF